MVDQLNAFASEVTRWRGRWEPRESWAGKRKRRTSPEVEECDNVNFMASNLTAQVRNIAEVTIAMASGDCPARSRWTCSGEIHQLKEAINAMVDQLNAFAERSHRVAREVGSNRSSHRSVANISAASLPSACSAAWAACPEP